MRYPSTAGHSMLAGLTHLADPKVAIASLVPLVVGAALTWRETHRLESGIAVTAGEVADIAIILGVLMAAVLLANELPDERADRAAGKRSLVVHIGRDLATSLIGFLFGVAFAVPITIVAYGGSTYLLGALLGAPASYVAWLLLRREYDRAPVHAQAWTLITYVLTGVGLAIGAIVV